MESKFIIPIEVRSSKTGKGRYNIRGTPKIVPNKTYSYLFKTDVEGRPVSSMKEMFSETGWERIKKKIMSKQIFVDENHKTVAAMNIDRTINDLSRETGKDLSNYKEKINHWMKVSEMPLFKLNDINDAFELDIDMNTHFRDIDVEHAAYFDATWKSLEDKFINSISLNFTPTEFKYNNEGIPVIDDIDVYGISLMNGPAYDDMYDCLDVAIRAAQNEIEKQEGGKNMTEIKDTIKKELKDEANAAALKQENDKLKKEIEEKDALLLSKEQAENEAEKQALIDEKAKLQGELEARNKKLQERPTGSRGLIPPPAMNVYAERQRVKEILKPLEEEKHLGKLIQMQHELAGLGSLHPDTQRLLRKEANDIVISKDGLKTGG